MVSGIKSFARIPLRRYELSTKIVLTKRDSGVQDIILSRGPPARFWQNWPGVGAVLNKALSLFFESRSYPCWCYGMHTGKKKKKKRGAALGGTNVIPVFHRDIPANPGTIFGTNIVVVAVKRWNDNHDRSNHTCTTLRLEGSELMSVWCFTNTLYTLASPTCGMKRSIDPSKTADPDGHLLLISRYYGQEID